MTRGCAGSVIHVLTEAVNSQTEEKLEPDQMRFINMGCGLSHILTYFRHNSQIPRDGTWVPVRFDLMMTRMLRPCRAIDSEGLSP